MTFDYLSTAMTQEPKMEVPTIYKAYFLGLCKGISPQNMALSGTVPPFRILEFRFDYLCRWYDHNLSSGVS